MEVDEIKPLPIPFAPQYLLYPNGKLCSNGIILRGICPRISYYAWPSKKIKSVRYAAHDIIVDGEKKRIPIATLLAVTFLGMPYRYLDYKAYYIDGNIAHNTVDNIAWNPQKLVTEAKKNPNYDLHCIFGV